MSGKRLSFTEQGIQFAWDSTSLTALKTCPRYYYYTIYRGFATRSESVHLTFGIHYHKGLELYDHYRAQGETHDEAVVSMVQTMMTATKGWKSDDNYKNRFTLIRSLVWYTEQFKNDPAETVILGNGKPAVELSFRFNLDAETPDQTQYLYCGHLDRLAKFAGATYVLDRKTSKSALSSNYFDKFRPNTQMTGYTLGGKIAFAEPVKGVIIDAAQIAVGFTRFSRGQSLRTTDELDEFLEETVWYIKLAEGYVQSDFWPKNEASCDKYGGCPFIPICSKSKGQRETWLAADYAKRLWDPLQVRGDI